MKKIFTPLKFGSLKLKNRFALGSMTRCRASRETGNITPEMVDYYSQRAESAGLIFTECVFVDKEHNSYLGAGGMITREHCEGWKTIVDAVHRQNTAIFAQLYHPGRALHSDLTGVFPMGPSPIKCSGTVLVHGESKEYDFPREIIANDIFVTQEQFFHAAKIAKKAGFDGIELHAANGYLIDQFLRSESNTRRDTYGGVLANRCRYLLELIDKISKIYPPERIGVKLSLVGRYNSMYDKWPEELGKFLLRELDKRDILYVQLMEAESRTFITSNNGHDQIEDCAKTFRKHFGGFLVTNGFGGMDAGIKKLEEDEADIAAISYLFVSNPDLVERVKNGWTLTLPLKEYFYTPGPKGYSDYPKYKQIN